MKTLNVGVLKSRFSEVLEHIKKGEEIVISFGKKKEKIAVIIPFKDYQKGKRKLGLLQGKAKCSIGTDFEMTEEELLSS
jgi:antitoxin (DNA-binding transcriptional repressor) of toxin-antitoxin stability system